MKILFVHGMGATRFDFLPNALRLKKSAYDIHYFSYYASFQSLALIRQNLKAKLLELAAAGDYAVIGHSLGGVLLREALIELADKLPGFRSPCHLFLLGSPISPTSVNHYLSRYRLYKWLSGECGQLVASEAAMAAIGLPRLSTTCVAGTRGVRGRWSPFGNKPNDTVVLVSELHTEKFTDVVYLDCRHPSLPANAAVSQIIQDRLKPQAS